jgi:hypothetical protein
MAASRSELTRVTATRSYESLSIFAIVLVLAALHLVLLDQPLRTSRSSPFRQSDRRRAHRGGMTMKNLVQIAPARRSASRSSSCWPARTFTSAASSAASANRERIQPSRKPVARSLLALRRSPGRETSDLDDQWFEQNILSRPYLPDTIEILGKDGSEVLRSTRRRCSTPSSGCRWTRNFSRARLNPGDAGVAYEGTLDLVADA